MTNLTFQGVHAEILRDTTPERLIEGALSSGKTTVALWAELEALQRHPGIWVLLTRWTDDAVKTLLRPAFEQLARIHGTGLVWHSQENYYALANGSRAFAFGLKTVSSDALQKYSKIRGLPVSRILFDQGEQGQDDVFAELRFRLRPDIEARLKGLTYPTQFTIIANPVPDDHPLAEEFPVTNTRKNRKRFGLSLFDNSMNLPPAMIENLLTQYPPSHPLYATRILGERGLTITGVPIYEHLFDRTLHVAPLGLAEDATFIEAFEFGKHNPTWVLAQRSFHGALRLLGGVMGKRLMLEDFLPVVQRYRKAWTEDARKIATCCSTTGETRIETARYSLVKLLRDAGFTPFWQDTANAHDVQLAMIESISIALRRRTTAKEESLQVNSDESRWRLAFPDGTELQRPFMAFAFEGGYVWDPHMVSVGYKELRQPRRDDEYANAMRCVENLMLNFIVGQRTDDERQRLKREAMGVAAASDPDPQSPHAWMRV